MGWLAKVRGNAAQGWDGQVDIGQRVVSNCIVHHLLSIYFFINNTIFITNLIPFGPIKLSLCESMSFYLSFSPSSLTPSNCRQGSVSEWLRGL